MTQTNPDSVTITLLAPDSVPAGAPIRFTLRIENGGAQPVDLYLRGRTLTFDVEVSDASGTIVWRRLEQQMIPAILHLRPLAPGERLEEHATWDQPAGQRRLEPGRYTARGLLLVEGPPRPTPPVRFQIVGR